MSRPFNIRVYGILKHNNKILLLNEPFNGKLICKFPGGGLEFGEGLPDCLHREFLEELNLTIQVDEHFYTQDFFLASQFNSKEQIIMIYYYVKALNMDELKILDNNIERIIWKDLSTLTVSEFTLTSDKVVVEKLLTLK